MSKKVKTTDLIVIFCLLFMLGFQLMIMVEDSGMLVIGTSYGISWGSPYTIKSIYFSSNLLKAIEGDYISYTRHNHNVVHQVIDITEKYYIVEAYNGYGDWDTDIVNKKDYISTFLFEIPLKETNDIHEACMVLNLTDDCSLMIDSYAYE